MQSLTDRLQESLKRVMKRKSFIQNSSLAEAERKRELEKIELSETLLTELLAIRFLDNWRHYDSQLVKMISDDASLSGVIILVEFRTGIHYGFLPIKINSHE
ncbi:MAG: hypothetical protein RL007_2552 [Bacteroidota bacterium]|jgi:hypothetical protein